MPQRLSTSEKFPIVRSVRTYISVPSFLNNAAQLIFEKSARWSTTWKRFRRRKFCQTSWLFWNWDKDSFSLTVSNPCTQCLLDPSVLWKAKPSTAYIVAVSRIIQWHCDRIVLQYQLRGGQVQRCSAWCFWLVVDPTFLNKFPSCIQYRKMITSKEIRKAFLELICFVLYPAYKLTISYFKCWGKL